MHVEPSATFTLPQELFDSLPEQVRAYIALPLESYPAIPGENFSHRWLECFFAVNFRRRAFMKMKRGPQARRTKSLSAKRLLQSVRKVFQGIPRTLKRAEISLTDCLMSALAMFGMESPSLLAFDDPKLEEPVRHNLKTLYAIDRVPSDTRMREILDEVDPRDIRGACLAVFHEVQRGKLLEHYGFLGGYLCLVDGSQIFNSEKVHCKNCCQKEHRDGRITYHHQAITVSSSSSLMEIAAYLNGLRALPRKLGSP